MQSSIKCTIYLIKYDIIHYEFQIGTLLYVSKNSLKYIY